MLCGRKFVSLVAKSLLNRRWCTVFSQHFYIFPIKSHHQTYTMRAIILFLLLSVNLIAQKPSTLPRSTPEAEGVSSQGIINFLEAAKASKHEFHSFMILRHGKVIAEGWWNPYRPDLKHTMYSVSKSFTATAVGFAVSEKLLSVNDKVISFFSDDLPANISPNLAELRVKDLLSMSVGHEKDPTGPVVGEKTGWKPSCKSRFHISRAPSLCTIR